jgi:hypothetical protein
MTQLGNTGLFCRREPPKNTLLPPTHANPHPMLCALWPEVMDDYWCGQWELDPKARTQ